MASEAPTVPSTLRISRWKRFVRLFLPAASVAFPLIALSLLYCGFLILPRPARRAIIELTLRGVLIGYSTVIVGSLLGLVVGGHVVYWARRRGERRPRLARLLLLCVSSLFSLAAAETASAAFLAWSHRMPALPTRFEPSDGKSHIVVLGGSCALGNPYNPWLSIGQVVSWQLEKALPGKRFQPDILADLNKTIEDMHLKLPDLKQRPAAMIIYSGHNEYKSRLEDDRDVDLDESPANPLLHRLYRVSLSSPLCRLVYQSLSKNRLDGPPPRVNRHKLIDAPFYTPSEAAGFVENFRRRMEAIVAYCDQIGALPIVVIEAGSEADYEPSRSLLPASATSADRQWVERQYAAARTAAADNDLGRAVNLFAEIAARFPAFAEAHFQLGRTLERSGRWAEAREHYLLALDNDALTIRATKPLKDICREVAARHKSCILVDGPAVLAAICPHGIVNDDAMHDGIHPNVRGITALSEAVLARLRERQAFGWTSGAAPALEPAAVADHFGFDSDRWVKVCSWGWTFYRTAVSYRFDPAERIAKRDRFETCRDQIAAGRPPDSTGFPCLSLKPIHASEGR